MATVAVLIRLKTNTHADTTKDVRGCYKRGDPVIARIDDGTWSPGAQEVWPDFAWLWLHGVSLAKVERFCFEEHDTSDGVRTATSSRVRRRLYRIELDSVPQGIRDIVEATSRLVIGGPSPDVTWAQVRAFIRNKKSNQTEADIGTTAGDLA